MIPSALNAAFGFLGRHTTAKLTPDPEVVKIFSDFVTEELSKDKYTPHSDHHYYSWEEYREQLEPKKRPLYDQGY